jgi:hypothetical protein
MGDLFSYETSSSVVMKITLNTIGGNIQEQATTPAGLTSILDARAACTGSGGVFCNEVEVSNVRMTSFSASGVYVSPTFNTGLSTPILSGFSVPQSSNTAQTITYKEATSSDQVTWSTNTITPGSFPVSHKQFWRYEADFATNSGTVTPSAYGLSPSLIAESTGYYISPCITAGGITSWGNLTADAVTNGGSFTFYMSTSSVSCARVTAANGNNWAQVTPNALISVPVSSYTAVRILFTIDAATQTPIVNDFAVNWNQGNTRPPVASSRYNDEYWLFFTSSTLAGAVNDHAMILDQNRHWTLFDDVNAYSATIYLNQLYIGDSNATGKVYQEDTGFSDNGKPFTMSFQTADLDGGDPLSRKKFRTLYLTVGSQTSLNQNAALACQYSLDGSSTTYSLQSYTMSESKDTSGYSVAKYAFPAGQPNEGHWINISCSNTGTAGPINIYSLKLVFKKTSWD